jgi:5'-methylthioadenosine phosphorylase
VNCVSEVRIGIIGGSGLYRVHDLVDVEIVSLDTPFGPPSDDLVIGTLSGVRVAFLPRHGRHHQYNPSRVPARANFWALKSLGVCQVISVSAVGSMREEIVPLDLVVPDQIFDRTVSRPRSFFEDGLVVHVALADPFCPAMRTALVTAAGSSDARGHDGGTYICIEGPQFSTRAESQIYRSWGVDVIGMTAMPEARLAREAEFCYAVLAMVTDYDVWHETEEPVNVSAVIENLRRNIETAQQVIRAVLPNLTQTGIGCDCRTALSQAIVTAPHAIPAEARERLDLLIGRYVD